MTFTCKCCSPARNYKRNKTLLVHQRKTGVFVEPRLARQLAYEANPRLCEACSAPLSYQSIVEDKHKKFCGHSCAAKVTNVIRTIRTFCIYCGNPKTKNAKYCSKKCFTLHRRDTIYLPNFDAGKVIWRPNLRAYLEVRRGWSCEICHNTEWLGSKINLEVDHIDGNASNNFPENLRLICPNCHSQQPTSKGKNRGKGRKALGLRL